LRSWRVCLRSIDLTHRIWMSDKAQCMDCVKIGEVMATVGVVEESKNADFPVGCHVFSFGGCCDYCVGIPGVNVIYKSAYRSLQTFPSARSSSASPRGTE
jgi:NADPH-dependent curcumin reductase CurA